MRVPWTMIAGADCDGRIAANIYADVLAVFAAPRVGGGSAGAQCGRRGARARPASAAAAPRRVLGQVTQAHPGQRREVRGGVLDRWLARLAPPLAHAREHAD